MKRVVAVLFAVLFCLVADALAQGPGSLNAGSQLVASGSAGAWTFSWWGAAGYTYLMETSDDLINWTYLPVVESGTGAAIQWGFTSTSSSLFMKLEYITVPVDQLSGAVFDGPDNNGNGLPDDWELFYYGTLGIDPNASVSWSNGTLTNLQAYQEGLSPLFGINLSVSLPAGVTNAALVWSDHTTGTETGYEILRETGTTGFQSIGFVLSGATNYNDYAVQGSTTYLYQVIALNGLSQVASSNQASIATLLDSNGDGIADIYKATYGIDPNDGTNSVGGSGLPDGWLIEYGLNPFTVADASMDLIGKGWSLADDYANGTNPNMVDTDGDGVPDLEDEYPLDPRRSQDVQAPPIALLNVSGSSATSDVTKIVIDDSDNTAFGTGWGDSPSFQAFLWQSGTATQTANIPLSGYNGEDFRQIESIDTSGNVYGEDFNYSAGFLTGFICQSGSITDLFPPDPPYSGGATYADTGFPSSSTNGLSYGVGYTGMAPSTLYPWLGEIEINSGAIQSPSGIAIFDPEFAEYGIDIPPGIQVIDADFSIYGMNDYGAAYGYTSQYGPTYWNGEELVPLPGTPYDGYTQTYGLNDQGQVIGISGGAINLTSGTAAYLWTSGSGGTGTTAYISSLLPPSYQKQIQNIYPFLITNQNPSDGSVKIYFNAQSLEGTGQGQWQSRTFMLQTMGTPDATGTIAQLTQIQMPAGTNVSLSQANASGISAGIGTATPDQSTQSAYQAATAQFKLRDDSDVTNGQWDSTPPTTTGSGRISNSARPDPWTSVAVGGTNSLTKLVTPLKSDLELAVQPGTEGSVTLGSGTTLAISATSTNLTVVGVTSGNAAILLRQKSNPALVSGTLNIDVLPSEGVPIDIFLVSDSGNAVNTAIPSGGITPQQIVDDLNEDFAQAAITFTLSQTGTLSAAGWSDTNGNLVLVSATDSPVTIIKGAAPSNQHLQMFIVKKIGGSTASGDTLGETFEGIGPCFVNWNAPALAFNHEVGHALGIATQNFDGKNHDDGPWPLEFRNDGLNLPQQGLMYPIVTNITGWIRKADWDNANTTAKTYK